MTSNAVTAEPSVFTAYLCAARTAAASKSGGSTRNSDESVLPQVKNLLHKLEESVRAEKLAKASLRHASRETARLVRSLQASGAKSFWIAHRLTRALGLPATLEARRRLAHALRQRALRFATRCRRKVEDAHGTAPTAAVPSEAIEKGGLEMPKEAERRLVKRVTEIFEEVEDEASKLSGGAADEDELDEDEDDESDDDNSSKDDEDRPTSRRRRSRRY